MPPKSKVIAKQEQKPSTTPNVSQIVIVNQEVPKKKRRVRRKKVAKKQAISGIAQFRQTIAPVYTQPSMFNEYRDLVNNLLMKNAMNNKQAIINELTPINIPQAPIQEFVRDLVEQGVQTQNMEIPTQITPEQALQDLQNNPMESQYSKRELLDIVNQNEDLIRQMKMLSKVKAMNKSNLLKWLIKNSFL